VNAAVSRGRVFVGVGSLPRPEERAVRLDSFFYRLSYRAGKPLWDTGEPHPELGEIIDGRQPGRALDLGCGTGANAVYLAQRGWEVVGVDFISGAIDTAISRARSNGSAARFICGDVTQLRNAGVSGPFDLIIDIGC
jgi:2-polyprenyl-3-methyl-5-hydroxy-6-metoxy-1,4-benzoquinol methylase